MLVDRLVHDDRHVPGSNELVTPCMAILLRWAELLRVIEPETGLRNAETTPNSHYPKAGKKAANTPCANG